VLDEGVEEEDGVDDGDGKGEVVTDTALYGRVQVPAGSGLSLAPSVLLPHKCMSIASLRALLASWTAADGAGLGDVQKQALSSYAIWLVHSKQLDKVGEEWVVYVAMCVSDVCVHDLFTIVSTFFLVFACLILAVISNLCCF
jgi:hypothetical protein